MTRRLAPKDTASRPKPQASMKAGVGSGVVTGIGVTVTFAEYALVTLPEAFKVANTCWKLMLLNWDVKVADQVLRPSDVLPEKINDAVD